MAIQRDVAGLLLGMECCWGGIQLWLPIRPKDDLFPHEAQIVLERSFIVTWISSLKCVGAQTILVLSF